MSLNAAADSRAVLVTGSTRGIGRSIAEGFVAADYRVGINGRSQGAVDAVVSQLGPAAIPVSGDVTSPEGANSVVDEFLNQAGRIDSLVCNVGDGRPRSSRSTDPDEWMRMLTVNLMSAVNVLDRAIPALTDSRGCVVLVSSIAGLRALGAPVAYASAKAALNSACRSWSREWGKFGVRVNVVAPGNVMFHGSTWEEKVKQNPDGVRSMLASQVPLGRFATPQEIAACCVFLSSTESSFITGQVISVDGGQTA